MLDNTQSQLHDGQGRISVATCRKNARLCYKEVVHLENAAILVDHTFHRCPGHARRPHVVPSGIGPFILADSEYRISVVQQPIAQLNIPVLSYRNIATESDHHALNSAAVDISYAPIERGASKPKSVSFVR